MKRILMSVFVVGSMAAIIAGGTFAYFNDTETSTGNTFSAGTLNLENIIEGTAVSSDVIITEGADGANDKVQFGTISPLKPGSNGTVTWVLSNTGNLAGTLGLVSTATFADVSANEPETAVSVPYANNGGANGDLDEFVGVRLQRGTGVDRAAAIADGASNYILGTTTYVPFSGLEAVLDAQTTQAMAASGGVDTIVYILSWNIATDIVGLGGATAVGAAVDDNIIQSDTAQLDITFTLTQI